MEFSGGNVQCQERSPSSPIYVLCLDSMVRYVLFVFVVFLYGSEVWAQGIAVLNLVAIEPDFSMAHVGCQVPVALIHIGRIVGAFG